jgi:hypothetical protein
MHPQSRYTKSRREPKRCRDERLIASSYPIC